MELMIGEPVDLPGPGTPPAPSQPGILLDVGGGELLAVMTIRGNVTRPVAESARVQLKELLQKGKNFLTVTCSWKLLFAGCKDVSVLESEL